MDLNRNIELNEEEDRHTARIQKILIAISWITYAIVMISGFYLADVRLITVTFVAIVMQFIPLYLIRRGKLKTSSLLLVINAIGTVTFVALVGQGVRDLALIACPIVFIFAGLMLDRLYFRVSVGIAMLCVLWLSVGEYQGWFIPVPFVGDYTIWIYLIMVSLLMVVGGIAVDLLASNMRRNLDQARLEILQRKRIEDALVKSEERFKLSMDATNDGLWDWDLKTDGGYLSPGYYRMLGYEPGDFPMEGSAWIGLIHPDDRENTQRVNNDCIEGRCNQFEVEYRMRAKDGEWRWILGRGKSVARDEQGRATRMLGTHMDITARKQGEELLRYQGTHDVLTGIYNRAFFEEELARLVRGRDFPVSVVVLDVDALKLVNDTYGHHAGDEMLVTAASVLSTVFREGDILARIGGDEFSALLPGTDSKIAESIVLRIKQSLDENNRKFPERPVNMSLGVATSKNKNILDAFKLADQRMYADKAARKTSQGFTSGE